MLVFTPAQKKQKLLEYAPILAPDGKQTVTEKDALRKSLIDKMPKMYAIWYPLARRNETKSPENRASSSRSANICNKRGRLRKILMADKSKGRFTELETARLVTYTSFIHLKTNHSLSVCVCVCVCVFVFHVAVSTAVRRH
jgi:hypothetical protein